MRSILDQLISPSQNAFVPGRSIGDTILLAQELFSGYNQRHLPPRCALKVDLRKAYDTVEWDFLRAVLTMFGFPERFIMWIVECVTTPSFFVCLNGAPHGFFRGARGLRQGDPMSPFLFVLVMEVLTLIIQQLIDQNGGFSYHWKCEAIKLFQLGFADDLLLFSKANTESIHLFKDGLTTFAELLGLQANLAKSHLILSRSAAATRDTLLTILDFQEGHLPLRYLGLPLLASRLTIADCQPILQKIDARIRGWEGVMLSFAGRVQLIKSVLSALQVYWAMAFILPKHIIKEIEKRLRNFLWKGSTEIGYAKVSWQRVCRPVSEGGLGIRDIQALNKGLMSRHLWRIVMHDRTSIWVTWILQYRLQDYSIWTIRARSGTWGWRKLIRLREALRPYIRYHVGDGTSFSLWHDPWHAGGPLILQFPSEPRHTSIPISAPLSTVIWEETWTWPHITHMESVDIPHYLLIIHGGRDQILWTGPRSSFSSDAAYDVFRPPGPAVDWSSLLVAKSHLILSRSAAASRDFLLAILDFQEGHLPLRYLGLPLLASRLTIADCQPILQKIDARIRGWEGVMLSFAGRVQLIKSFLSALQVYWAMVFILPKHINKEIERRLRNFLWKGSIEMGYAKVSWQKVCRPVSKGGLGIRDIQALNKSLMSRHLWRIVMHDHTSIWVTLILQYKLQDCSIWTIRARSGTWGWRKLIRLRDVLRPYILYQIGEGTSFSLWHDPWHARGPLILQFPSGPRHTSIPISAPLSTVIWEDT
ncbi:UNVERIFIED_CONTAM: Retrovirus-related Pol polyprotein from type-2 retrotransposable element R2DM [Sesamum radiatum]|uniref:Retrovirus-related Pol polyprotein from type-2 retrotransposable element R2DM n=1 Tax=Sesamum radiatum TaxID=300843 RepID=A0AAW2J0W6_SESRA